MPEPDITAYELALILGAVMPGGGLRSMFQEIELPHGQEIDPRIARHFQPVPVPF